jgi:hypothetical protein
VLIRELVVKRLIAITIVTFLANGALAASSADEAFESLAEQFVGDLPTLSPVASTWIGDHSRDAELDQVDADARAGLKDALEAYQEALGDIDRSGLSRANQVDYELLRSEISSRLWSLQELQEWAWNPLYYVNTAGSSIYNLVAREFAPAEERLANVASRLEQFPRFLEQARASLQPERVPKIHAETAVAQNLGVVSIIENMIVPQMDSLTDATRTRLEAAKNCCRGQRAIFASAPNCSIASSRSRSIHHWAAKRSSPALRPSTSQYATRCTRSPRKFTWPTIHTRRSPTVRTRRISKSLFAPRWRKPINISHQQTGLSR